MKLLILTQKVNTDDDILGFFHRWIEEFGKQSEKVTVICLEQGVHQLPKNISVFSLGKERGVSKLMYLVNFYRFIWRERKNYDAVFVHMNPEYVLLGGLVWRFLGKKIGLWYTHKAVNLKLWFAEKLSGIIFTAAKESFNLVSKKVNVVGHGIDIDAFKKHSRKNSVPLEILHVGRITAIKNIDILVEAVCHLKTLLLESFNVILVGSPVTSSDKIYAREISEKISEYGLDNTIKFVGSVPNRKVSDFYKTASCTVNLTPTGGIDKAVLESMASGVPVFTSNLAFQDYFGQYANRLIFKERDPVDLARKIKVFFESKDQYEVIDFLRGSVEERASIGNLVRIIIKNLS